MSKTHPLDLEEFHRYKECTTKWVTHFVEQTCDTDYHTVFRCAEEGQISAFDPLQRKIRCRSARKESPNTENIDITTEIRPDTWKFSFGIAPLRRSQDSRTDFRDKKSSDFSGEIFRERNYCPRTAFSGSNSCSILSNQVFS